MSLTNTILSQKKKAKCKTIKANLHPKEQNSGKLWGKSSGRWQRVSPLRCCNQQPRT